MKIEGVLPIKVDYESAIPLSLQVFLISATPGARCGSRRGSDSRELGA